jgi:hypothetical protein
MPMEFDAVSKYLLDAGPREWLELCGCDTSAEIVPVVSDLSTVTANADKFYRIKEKSPWLVNFEPYSSRDKSGPARICLYSVLGLTKLKLPVHTVVVLLSPRADGPQWTGDLLARVPGKTKSYLTFSYDVLRVWEIPPKVLLKGGIATLALAPISKIEKNELPELMRTILDRVDAELPPDQRQNYLAAMCSLMGLCYKADFVAKLIQGFDQMRESSVVQLWIKEGEAKGVAKGEVKGIAKGERQALLTVLSGRFGKIGAALTRRLSKIEDSKQLNHLVHFAAIDPDLQTFVNRIKNP